jgi:hypothetical protein
MVDIDWVCGTCGSVRDEKVLSTETVLSITDVGEDCPMITHLLLNGRYDCGSSFANQESMMSKKSSSVVSLVSFLTIGVGSVLF